MPVPDEIDPALAGALGVAGLAGWLPVAVRAPVREGETVLVLGATGTVGLVAMQGARVLGAGRVVAAGRRPEALERAARLGADATVALEGDVEEMAAAFRNACGGEGPTLVVDPLWGLPVVAAARAAARRARIVHIGQSAGPEAPLLSADVRGKELEILGYSNLALPHDVMAREYLRLVELAREGKVEVDVETVPFERFQDAWRRQAEGAGVKLVVRSLGQSLHQPGRVSASPAFPAPKTSSSAPSGPASKARVTSGAMRTASHWPHLDHVVVELHAPAAGEHDVDLLLVLVAVPERAAVARSEALVAEAALLRLERLPREAGLELRREPALDGRVLDLLQVPDRVAGHASRGYRPTISSGRTGARTSSRPVASRRAATIAAVETTVGGSPTPLTP